MKSHIRQGLKQKQSELDTSKYSDKEIEIMEEDCNKLNKALEEKEVVMV